MFVYKIPLFRLNCILPKKMSTNAQAVIFFKDRYYFRVRRVRFSAASGRVGSGMGFRRVGSGRVQHCVGSVRVGSDLPKKLSGRVAYEELYPMAITIVDIDCKKRKKPGNWCKFVGNLYCRLRWNDVIKSTCDEFIHVNNLNKPSRLDLRDDL